MRYFEKQVAFDEVGNVNSGPECLFESTIDAQESRLKLGPINLYWPVLCFTVRVGLPISTTSNMSQNIFHESKLPLFGN